MNDMTGIPKHWWGKAIGAFLGLLRGGISGAIIGALIGHMLDRFIAGLGRGQATRQLFFRTLFATLGHVNKADGRVTPAEIQSAEALMARLQLTSDERQLAIRLFNEGKASDYPLEQHLSAFAHHTVMRHDLRHMLVEILLEAASSDGKMSEAERGVLLRVCHSLHIPGEAFEAMWNSRWRASDGGPYRRRAPSPGGQTLDQAYAALGVGASAKDAEVKRAYRKLVAQYHPDKLVSRGLPEEMMEVARRRVREINTAYEQIKQARGFK